MDTMYTFMIIGGFKSNKRDIRNMTEKPIYTYPNPSEREIYLEGADRQRAREKRQALYNRVRTWKGFYKEFPEIKKSIVRMFNKD